MVGEAHGATSGGRGGAGAINGAGWGINVILVNVAKLLVHGVVIEGLALVGLLLALEVARAHEPAVGLVGDHGVAPPVVHRAKVVVVIVGHRISHLHSMRFPQL